MNVKIVHYGIGAEYQNCTPPRYAAPRSISSRVAAAPPPTDDPPVARSRGDEASNDEHPAGIWHKSCSLTVSHSADNAELGWITEDREKAERGYEDEDEDDDLDQDEDDDLTEACLSGVGSRIDPRILSTSALDVDNIQSHVSGRGEKGKGTLPTPRKRSAPLGFSASTQDDIQDDDESAGKPSKRPKEHKGAKDVLHHQSKRPFACPYFKKNPLKYVGCAGWRNTKLSLVKTHCMSEHLKSRCPRCKIYRGIQSDIIRHLEDEDCKKPETYDPSEERTTEEKVQELNKAKTWRRIYEILFPLYIPDQFWQNTIEALVAPNDEDELSFIDRVQLAVSIREQTYRVAISEFLRERAGSGVVDELLDQFDKVLESKTWNQDSLDDLNNSRAVTNDTQIHGSLPRDPPKAELPSISSSFYDSTAMKYESQSKLPASAGKNNTEQHLHGITSLDDFPNQCRYSVEHLIPIQDPGHQRVDISNFSEFQPDLLGQSFANDPGSQDIHDYVNVDDDMFEYGGEDGFEEIGEDFLEPGGMGYSL
ncbi:hypothetical protein DFP73DRAFT_545032 [Morchella snyderi]|nr:hypothetical protein DFP73DRAFT_545032 [Morchella snyderi]